MRPHRAGHADFLLAGPQHDGGQLIVQVPVETTTPLRETPPLALRHSERGRGGREVNFPLSWLMRSAVGMPPLERPTARTRPLKAPDLSTVRLAAERGDGQEGPGFPRREGPRVEAHAGGVVHEPYRTVRLHEAWEEAGRAGRRRSLAPRPAHGEEADQVAGVVQVASDLAERVGGELDRPTALRRHSRRDPSLFTVWRRMGWRR